MRTPVIVASLVALGCPSGQPAPVEPPAGFEHAYAAPSCAPWDGYAVSLVLRRAPLAPLDSAIEKGDEPQLRLSIYPRDMRGPGRSGLRAGTVHWPADREVAIGALCEGGRCTVMPSGSITIRDADDDGRLRGSVDLRLRDARSVRGTFDAEWRQRTQLCG